MVMYHLVDFIWIGRVHHSKAWPADQTVFKVFYWQDTSSLGTFSPSIRI